MNILGIDPGQSGGIVRIGEFSIDHEPMPDTERDIVELLRDFASLDDTFAFIEWIHPAIQGVGKASMSKLYGNYMGIRMAMSSLKIPFETVQAKVWQRHMGISPRKQTENGDAWKSRLKARAQELFPSLPIWDAPKSKGKQMAICDALLIAEYGRRLRSGELVSSADTVGDLGRTT